MTTIMVILVASMVGFAAATWWRVPVIPLLLLLGVALGATGMLGDTVTVRQTMLLGLTFLVFVVGAELDFARVTGQWRPAIAAALTQFAVLATLAFGAARLLRIDTLAALYIAVAVTASSTLVIITLLRQRQQFFEPFGRVVIGVLLVQDFIVLLALPVLTRATEDMNSIAIGLVATLTLMGMALVCRAWLCPLLFLRLRLDDESMLLAVLTVLFGFIGLSLVAGLPLVIGAFLAGVSLSGFPVNGLVRGHVTSLADFFLAVFFVTLGASVSLPGLRQLAFESLLLGTVLLAAPPIVVVVLRRLGLGMRSAIEASHLLAQCGELSIVVVLLGVERGHVSPGSLSVVVLVAVVTMSLTPWLATDTVTWRLMHWFGRRRHAAPAESPRGHILMLGCGRNTRLLLPRLIATGLPVLVVDDDAGTVEALRREGIQAVRGDGADYRLLRLVGARDARIIVSTMRRLRDHERLLRFADAARVLIRVFDPADGVRLRQRGATVIVESEAAVDQFLDWFDHTFRRSATSPRSAVEPH